MLADIRRQHLRKNPKKRFSKPPVQLFPETEFREYRALLVEQVAFAGEAIKALLLPQLKALERRFGITDSIDSPVMSYRLDGPSDEVASIMQAIKGRVKALSRFATANRKINETASKVSDKTRTEMTKQVRSTLAVDIFSPDTAPIRDGVASWLRENIELYEEASDRLLMETERAVLRGFRGGRRASSISGDIEKIERVSASRAEMIARDQIAKLNGAITKERQTALGITKYIWRTSNDERVRTSHRELNGETFSWSNPPPEGHPGQPINCRCRAEPIFE